MTSERLRRLRRAASAIGLFREVQADQWATLSPDATRWQPDEVESLMAELITYHNDQYHPGEKCPEGSAGDCGTRAAHSRRRTA